jgi:hypothetical protein
VTRRVPLTSLRVATRPAIGERSGPRPVRPIDAGLGQVVTLPADPTRLHAVSHGEVLSGASVGVIDEQLFAGVARPAKRDEVVHVVGSTVASRLPVVDLRPVVASAEDAYTPVSGQGEAPLSPPRADVRRYPAAAPEHGLVSALGQGLAVRVASPRADDLGVTGVTGERLPARDARLGDRATSAPPCHPVALGRAAQIPGRSTADRTGSHALIIQREAEYADWAEARIADGKPAWAVG